MRAQSNPYLVLLALWLLVFSASSQVIIIAPILPDISAALSVSEGLLGILSTVYAIMLSIFALITGPISDKIGRRRILLLGSGSLAGALALHGVADTFVSLLIVRALAGAAGGTLSGAAVAYVGDYFPYERRGWANGWVMSGIAFGQIIGIPIGKIVADLFGFRWPFLVFALTMAVATVLIWRFVPQPDVQRDRDRLSIRRAVSNYGQLLKNPETAAAAAVYFLMFFSIGLYVTFLPLWLQQQVGITGTEIAVLFLVGGVANMVSSPVAGHLSDRIGRKPLIIASCLGMSGLMVGTTYLVGGVWSASVLFALIMVMVALRISPLQSLLTALVPGARRGILMSLSVAIGQIGFGVASGLAGFTYVAYGFLSNTLVGALLLVLMAFLVQGWMPEPQQEPAPGYEPAS